jgi:hypothetical protein
MWPSHQHKHVNEGAAMRGIVDLSPHLVSMQYAERPARRRPRRPGLLARMAARRQQVRPAAADTRPAEPRHAAASPVTPTA